MFTGIIPAVGTIATIHQTIHETSVAVAPVEDEIVLDGEDRCGVVGWFGESDCGDARRPMIDATHT